MLLIIPMQVMYCPDPDPAEGEEAAPLKPVEQVEFDGCVFKNESYAKSERFYDGCEQQCQCMGYGDMVCLSRCPPTASAAPGQNCFTLQDASDPCCNITVCDKAELDPALNVNKKQQQVDGSAEEKSSKQPRIVNEPFGKHIKGANNTLRSSLPVIAK